MYKILTPSLDMLFLLLCCVDIPKVPCNHFLYCGKKFPVFWNPQSHICPLSSPTGSSNTFCCLFIYFSPPKRITSRREGFLEAGMPVKTCKCHINKVLWLVLGVGDYLGGSQSAWAFSKINNGNNLQSGAVLTVSEDGASYCVHPNIWCFVFWWWQPKRDGSELL